MVTIPINLTGGTYKHQSRPLSAQLTRNFWPQLQQDGSAKSPYILTSFPGKKLFGTSVGFRDRGMLEHKSILYKVTDTTLYSVDSAGTHTTLGTIPGVAHTIMAGIGNSVVIITEGVAYEWTGSVLNTGTDIDFETPQSCAHLNNQMLYDGDGGRFVSSNVGAPLALNSLNYATAESNADDIVRVYVHDQTAYMLGEVTTEPWWNSGVGQPPFDRIENAISQVGLGALHSVASTKDWFYFVGHDNQVYRANGSNIQPVFTNALAREIAKFATIADAKGVAYNLEGQWMYEVTFPTADRTFCHPENGETFELSSGTDGGKNIASSHAFVFGKNLIGDSNSGNIYELDSETFTDNGDIIVRTRDTGSIHGELLGAAGKSIEMNRFELVMETGVGLLSGQGQDPKIVLSFSDDGGRTFSTVGAGTVGKLGQYQHKIEWFALGSFYERVIRLQISDPIYVSI